MIVCCGPAPEAKLPAFNDLARELRPTVVNLRVEGPGGAHGASVGSGVIVTEDGLVLTNRHLVEGETALRVTVDGGGEYGAVLVADAPESDLALLRIEGAGPFEAARLGDSDRVEVGEWVLAFGNPFGIGITLSVGVVSATGRYVGEEPYDALLQTDAAINPGNSGGPLFNARGELVGINSAAIALGQGIGFARPINEARSLLF